MFHFSSLPEKRYLLWREGGVAAELKQSGIHFLIQEPIYI